MSVISIILFVSVFILILAIGVWPCVYLLAKNLGWKKKYISLKITIAVTLVYVIFYSLTGFLAPDINRHLADLMGVLNFAFAISVFYWCAIGILWFTKKDRQLFNKTTAYVYIASVVLISLFASYNYYKPLSIEAFTINSNKITREYRFVQVTDTQFGTATKNEMAQAMRLAYQQNPDFIVFTGDLIDFDYYVFEDFMNFSESPVPIYFSRGNHEFYHDSEKLMGYLERIEPIEMLINQKQTFEELEIIGIDYSREENYLAKQLQSNPPDADKFSILLYHAPREVEVAIEKEVDIFLAGHVHGGQIWPWTWVVDFMYTYADGAYQISNTFIYTSDGAALWGPRMRFGSQNEIAVFTLIPE